jgi:polyisoprenoid-binding protein YceI
MTPEPAAQRRTFRLVPDQSRFTVHAFAEGLLSAFGHDLVILISGYAGEIEFDPETYQSSGLRITVDPNSLSVSSDVKEKDKTEIERTMHDEVLETATYPEIVFTSSNVSVSKLSRQRCRVRVIGDLTLHGQTQKSIWISGEGTVSADELRVHGEFLLRQTDFGIRPYSAVGGTIKLKNELKFSFDICWSTGITAQT